MYIIAGLGNPGKKYENTRHNIGFDVIYYLENKLNIKVNRLRFKALTGETRYNGKKILLMMPQTYMNLSGESIREAVDFYKIPLENLIVIYDDLDIETEKIRIRPSGSGGSHNGMRSIISHLGKGDFPRIRMGIGEETPMIARDFVLSRFPKEKEKEINDQIRRGAEAALAIVDEDINSAMNKYNG